MMALKKIIEITGKNIFQTQYGSIEKEDNSINDIFIIRVSAINGTKLSIVATVTFSSEKLTFSKQYEIPMETSENSYNFIKQAYFYLKTLPEFSGAEDC